jgi:CheY-like chemotaxis protein
VDDEPDITGLFSLALEDTGLFEVETYNDPTEALSNFKSSSYDIVLLDIKMPKMSGFELCDRIKNWMVELRCVLSVRSIRIPTNSETSFYHLRLNVLFQSQFLLRNL